MLAEPSLREPVVLASAGHGPSLGILASRATRAAGIAAAECIALAIVDHPQLPLPHAMAGPICFALALLLFGRQRLAACTVPQNIDRRFLALHLLAAAVLVACESVFLSHPGLHPPLVTITWSVAVLTLLGSLLRCLFPGRSLVNLASALGRAWAYAGVIALPFLYFLDKYDGLWNGSSQRVGGLLQRATFTSVGYLLNLLYGNSIAIPSASVVGTHRFQVEIAPGCSGMEGIALVLILTAAWLVYHRAELRVRRALLLIPLSLALAAALNVARITALVAIGDAGHADIALHGFHSEAGWLCFNLVAAGFLLVADRVEWFHRGTLLPSHSAVAETSNVVTVYLLPFLAVVAAGMVNRALTSGLEWLYPLRPALALLVLWQFRRDYRRLDWRFDWLGPLAGAGVFVLWIVSAHWQRAAPSAVGERLADLGSLQRLAWIAVRVLSAVLVIPVVEELAFRGFLARRLVAEVFEDVRFGSLTLASIVVSSMAFGLLHGRLWPVGIVAGIAFALVCRIRGRLGEAVAAHATANLLLAIWVLARQDYTLW